MKQHKISTKRVKLIMNFRYRGTQEQLLLLYMSISILNSTWPLSLRSVNISEASFGSSWEIPFFWTLHLWGLFFVTPPRRHFSQNSLIVSYEHTQWMCPVCLQFTHTLNLSLLLRGGVLNLDLEVSYFLQ